VSIDLKKLEDKLDSLFENETSDTFEAWLKQKRMEHTPKQKAAELISKMNNVDKISNTYGGDIALFESIECALVAVDEILSNFGLLSDGANFYANHDAIKFYQEVKQEIEREKQERYGE
jgi:hypothetical protein